jgi:uncharacterized protein (TIGR03000 family)
VLLLLPETSAAQWRGGGIGVGSGRFGVYYGSARPFYSGYYPGFGSGYYPGFGSGYYGWNTPYYGSTWNPRSYGDFGYSRGYPRGWAGPSYDYRWSAPQYYSSTAPSGTAGPYYASEFGRGYYGTPGEMPRSDQTVLVRVHVPAEAEIWFGGAKTQQTGTAREFISPVLEPGQEYTYEVRARWMQDGQEVVRTRDLRVRAGNQYHVDFLSEAPSGTRTDPSIDRTAPGTDRNFDRTPVTPNRDLDRPSSPPTPNPDPARPGNPIGGSPSPDRPE